MVRDSGRNVYVFLLRPQRRLHLSAISINAMKSIFKILIFTNISEGRTKSVSLYGRNLTLHVFSF